MAKQTADVTSNAKICRKRFWSQKGYATETKRFGDRNVLVKETEVLVVKSIITDFTAADFTMADFTMVDFPVADFNMADFNVAVIWYYGF